MKVDLLGTRTLPPVFSPAQISPALWLDASDVATITKDGANLVSQWNDKSGNGRNVVQAAGAKQPLWTAAAINGLDAIAFNGATTYLQNTTAGGSFSGLAGEVWAVVRTSVSGAYGSLLASCETTPGANDYFVWYGMWPAANGARVSMGFGGLAWTVNGSLEQPVNTTYVMRLACDGVGYAFEIDNRDNPIPGLFGSVVNNGLWFGDIPNRGNFTIGMSVVDFEVVGQAFNGYVCEFLVVDGAMLSTVKAMQMRQYLTDKWS